MLAASSATPAHSHVSRTKTIPKHSSADLKHLAAEVYPAQTCVYNRKKAYGQGAGWYLEPEQVYLGTDAHAAYDMLLEMKTPQQEESLATVPVEAQSTMSENTVADAESIAQDKKMGQSNVIQLPKKERTELNANEKQGSNSGL